jgi:hypothetical protein
MNTSAFPSLYINNRIIASPLASGCPPRPGFTCIQVSISDELENSLHHLHSYARACLVRRSSRLIRHIHRVQNSSSRKFLPPELRTASLHSLTKINAHLRLHPHLQTTIQAFTKIVRSYKIYISGSFCILCVVWNDPIFIMLCHLIMHSLAMRYFLHLTRRLFLLSHIFFNTVSLHCLHIVFMFKRITLHFAWCRILLHIYSIYP